MIRGTSTIDPRRLLLAILVISLAALSRRRSPASICSAWSPARCASTSAYRGQPPHLSPLWRSVAGLGRRLLLPIGLCAVIFAAGGALAFYHVGVEQHWWGSVAGCAGEAVTDLTLDDLRPEALATGG